MTMEDDVPDLTVLFDITPENFPWRAPVAREIEARRALMSDTLIFDILLTAGGVRKPHTLYPPRDVQTLRKLLDAIEATTYDGLKKDCLIYFLLKWHQDNREIQFMDERCIPPQFAALADAYWYLDSGLDVPRAVSLLSDARLNRDYVSKIIQAISLSDDANILILQYIRTAKPILSEPDDVDAYSIALAESSLFEAWQYQRSFLEDSQIRPRVLKNILKWCLSPKPRAKALAQLLGFPFSNYEQTMLHDFALHPPEDIPASSIPVIQDLACVRLIQSGQFAAAVKLDRQIGITPINGTFGSRINDYARRVAQDRKHTMDEIMAVMPTAERQLLEAELEQMSRESDSASFLSRSVDKRPAMNNGRDATKVPRKPLSTSAVLPIPQRSGAPRFGGPISAGPASSGPISTGASTSVATAREAFESLSANQSANFESISAGRPQRERSKSKPLAQEDTDPILENINIPPTGIPLSTPTNVPVVSTSISANGVKPISSARARSKEPVSLFETKGSANQTPNAFFKPPAAAPSAPSAGVKRPYPGPSRPSLPTRDTDMSGMSAQDVTEMLENPMEDSDVDMHDSDGSASKKAKLSHKSAEPEEHEEEAFNTSVFAGISAHTISHPVSFEPSSTPMPPGGFDIDFDGPPPEPTIASAPREQPTSNISNKTDRTDRTDRTDKTEEDSQPSVSASRAQPKRQSSRIPRMSRAISKDDLSKSVPGAFVEEEEDDIVPPLPPPTPARRGRKARAAEVKEAAPRITRRSSRLSAVSASERGSSSPEPPSPEVRRTRSTTGTGPRTSGGVTKGRTRKARA